MFLVIAAISPIILFTQVLGANIAIAVLADGLAVGFVLFALIEIFGPICIAYFNPVVCFSMALNKSLSWKKAVTLSVNQILGGLTGVLLTHLMFYQNVSTIVTISNIPRSGGTYLSEILCTFILVLAIFSLTNQKSPKTSLVVGLLVGGLLIATSSTMFANSQVTLARMFTYSEAGINPIDGLVFILMQFIGASLAVLTWKKIESFCCDFKCNN
jgi:glycerol uptake facilitator-like aquaporin